MLSTDKKSLAIFERFEIDRTLPKNAIQTKVKLTLPIENPSFGDSENNPGAEISDEVFNQIMSDLNSLGTITVDGGNFRQTNVSFGQTSQGLITNTTADGSNSQTSNQKKSFWSFSRKKKNKKEEIEKVPEPPLPKLSINDFFTSVKNSAEEIEIIENRIENYVKAARHAHHFRQTALLERLLKNIKVYRSETQLYAMGFKKTISEEQIINFYKDSEKGLKLYWIKNYTRLIPEKFVSIKASLDFNCIFDNYCILCYDPEGRTFQETLKEEEERKRPPDPILFGLIENSRKLYYIGDWVDEYCDLTIEKFIDKFGEEAISKNDISAEIKI